MAKVMLVEDDNNLREIYEARLQAEGYVIVSAHDGEEALVVAKAEKPDLIISDVMMPKISGFEMLDILRNTDGLKDVKVIMLTALGQSDDQQRANKLGADRYLVKSQVTLEDIVKATHDLLGEDEPAAPAATPAPTPTPAEPTAAMPVAPAPASDATAVPAPVVTPEPAAPAVAAPSITSAPPSPPVAAPTAQPTTAPPVTPVTDTAAAASNDDQVMAEAVNKLIADADKKPNTPAPSEASAETESEAEPVETPDKTANTDEKTEEAKDKEDDDPQNGHVTIANKKIITPLDDKPDKDLNALLAEEEAKEAASAAGATFQPTPGGDPAVEKAAESVAQEEAALDSKIEDFVAGASSEPDTPAGPPPAIGNMPVPTPKPAPAAETPAPVPAQPVIKPIVVSEPAAPAGAEAPAGAPAASPSGNPTPPDPNTIAL